MMRSATSYILFLKFFLDDNTLEILGTQRHLLKRIYYLSVTASDLFRGNSITGSIIVSLQLFLMQILRQLSICKSVERCICFA